MSFILIYFPRITKCARETLQKVEFTQIPVKLVGRHYRYRMYDCRTPALGEVDPIFWTNPLGVILRDLVQGHTSSGSYRLHRAVDKVNPDDTEQHSEY